MTLYLSGRNVNIKRVDDMVGLFINTIPLRIKSNSNQQILDLLKEVDKMLIDRSSYENTPLVEIQSYCDIKNNEALFDSIVVIENYPLDKQINNKDNILKIDSYSMTENVDFNLAFKVITFEDITFEISYNEVNFDKETISRMSNHFTNILKVIVDDCTTLSKKIDILTNDEKNKLLVEFNDTYASYPRAKTICGLMSISWTQKVKLFYAALLANNSH